MVRFIFFKLIFFLVVNLTVFPQSIAAKNYFVVIGEFTKLTDAQQLTNDANLKTFHAHFMMDDMKQQYYVYLLRTSDQKKAKSFLKRIRKETEYKKARFYKGNQVEFQ